MNRRELKKTINKIVQRLADEALELEASQTASKDEANRLIDDAATLLDDIMYQVNHHSQLHGKEVKFHFLSIEREFETRFKALEERLDKMRTTGR